VASGERRRTNQVAKQNQWNGVQNHREGNKRYVPCPTSRENGNAVAVETTNAQVERADRKAARMGDTCTECLVARTKLYHEHAKRQKCAADACARRSRDLAGGEPP